MEKERVYLHFNGECNVGKTVAWCCIYKKMNEGIGNFRLEYKGKEEDNAYNKMYLGMRQGKDLPVGTSEMYVNTFQFKKGNEDICEVIGMDYSNSSIGYDREIHERMLKEATIEIYMIPADVINDYICIHEDNVSGTIEREMKRINITRIASRIKTCMVKLEELREDHPPVLFYLTQSDRIKCPDEEKMEMLKKYIKRYNFFNFAEGKGRKVLGCHSTLGRTLQLDNNRILSGFAPEGFEIPFLVAAGYHRKKR